MAVLSRLFETRSTSFMDLLLRSRSVGMETASGRNITALGALQSTAVFACVRILAESVASLPLILYRRLPNGGKTRAANHPLFPILHDLPNPEITSFELREMAMAHLGLWGNAYYEIQVDRGGRPLALWPLTPWRVEPDRSAGRLVYRVIVGDRLDPHPKSETLPFERVVHVRGFGVEGVKGLSPIGLARQAIGLTLALEEHGARFFGNGARPGSVLEHPGKLSDDSHGRLRESWEETHGGLANAHRVAILEEGMKLHEVGIPPEDAQFLETRKFQTNEIARLYRIPPHMIGDLERATFTNIEHQSLEFVQHSLRPWLVRWEQAYSRDLIDPRDRGLLFVEHLVDALLRGDIESRYSSYAVGRQWGWLSADDVREFENMNPLPDGAGQAYLTPLNMVPAAEAEEQGSRGAEEQRSRGAEETRVVGIADDRLRVARSTERVLVDVAGRVIRREVNDVRRAVTRFLGRQDVDGFRQWLRDFYEEHRAFWVRNLLPVMLSFADQIGLAVARELETDPRDNEAIAQFLEDYIEGLAVGQAAESFGQLRALLDEAVQAGEDPGEPIVERVEAWEENRAELVARDESRQAGNAFARQFYILAGIARLRWVNRGSENCPYCEALNGVVVGIQEFFLQKDVPFQPEGASRPLSRVSNVRHPQLHKGCDCQIVAERV